MTDIQSRNDIIRLIDRFYEKIKVSDIGFIFTEVAKLDFDRHLPVMYDFWCSMLLQEQSYQGNPMTKHLELARRTALGDKEFGVWLQLFHETVDELFAGPKAEEAKQRSTHIAGLMKYKIAGSAL